MLVACLQHLASSGGILPTSRLELYSTATRVSVHKRTAGSKQHLAAVIDMLATIAVANHMAQRREFSSVDVRAAFAILPSARSLWDALEHEELGLPLIKTLEVGSKELSVGFNAHVQGEEDMQGFS